MKHFLTAVVLTLTLGPATAQDIENGLALSEENCARCHDIAPGGASKMHPPSFAAIAGYRPEEVIVSRVLFPSLHASMPSWVNWLPRDDVDDIVAYILSLEGS